MGGAAHRLSGFPVLDLNGQEGAAHAGGEKGVGRVPFGGDPVQGCLLYTSRSERLMAIIRPPGPGSPHIATT